MDSLNMFTLLNEWLSFDPGLQRIFVSVISIVNNIRRHVAPVTLLMPAPTEG